MRTLRGFDLEITDYNQLEPGRLISNTTIDFFLRLLQPDGPKGQDVWIMTNFLAQQIRSNSSCFLQNSLNANVYEQEGCYIIFMAWIESAHFFSIVGICDIKQHRDKVYVLESIGGYSEPLGVKVLKDYMNRIRKEKGFKEIEIASSSLNVPKQRPGSYDCGIFLLHNAKLILENPSKFIFQAENNDLGNWYSESDVLNKRSEMKNTLKKLSEDQRCKGVSAVRLRNKQVNFDKSTITVPNMSFQAVSSVDTYPPKKSVLGSQESELVASAFKNPQQKSITFAFLF